MKRNIKYYVEDVRFVVEWFNIDLSKDKEEQVKKVWDSKNHTLYETYHTETYSAAVDMARYILLSSKDYNYAIIFVCRYENYGTDDVELIDSTMLGDVIAE